MSTATLNDLSATSALLNVPAWGRWRADASVDGEHVIAPGTKVALKIADLTVSGTVLSGGPSKGRSSFRLVAGAGGWGKRLKKKSYANDAGVKLATVLGDAAAECGETLGPIDPSLRVGPSWTRPEGSGASLLNELAPRGWYVDNDGVTQLGGRPVGTLPANVTHGPVDLAAGTVTLASETIAAILPGLVVDGLTVVDVEHDVSAKTGLRSTVWGSQGGGSSRGRAALEKVFDQLDPRRKFRNVSEYVVDGIVGKRLNLEPVQVSLGMPALTRVPVRPGAAGCEPTVVEGMRVLVGFVNADPGRAYVAGFDELESDAFQPATLNLLAGGQAGGEHVATVEGMVVFIHNLVFALAALGVPALWLTSGAIVTAINAALAASNAPPAPPTAVAQVAAAPAQVAAMASGPGTSSAPYTAAIASALSTKISNESGLFPSVGSAAVEAG